MPQRHRNWWPPAEEYVQHRSPSLHQPQHAPLSQPAKSSCKTLGQLEAELLARSFSALQPAQDNHRPELRAAVLLTDTSQELLLSIVPPLHPFEATTSPQGESQPLSVSVGEPCSSVQQLLTRLPAPIGTDVQVEIVGIAADDRSQAVAVRGPPWLAVADGFAPHPYLLISHIPEAHPSEAGQLIASGLAGLVGDCYQPLDEGLPLVGVLGLLCSDGSKACTHDQLQQLQGRMEAGQANDLAAVQAPTGVGVQLRGEDGVVGTGVAGEQMKELQQAMAVLSTSASQDRAASVGDKRGSGVGRAGEGVRGSEEEAVGAGSSAVDASAASAGRVAKGAEGSLPAAEDDEFEVWMQLDEHAAPGVHLPPKPAHPRPSAPPTSASLVVPADLPPPVPGERMRWLDDVHEGDLVEVVPLSHKQGEVEEREKGIVDEVVVDDLFQSQGVLVRLQEDNTMGHVARVIASQHRQQQEAWPSLTPGTGPSAAPSTSAPTNTDGDDSRSLIGAGAAPTAAAAATINNTTTDDSEAEGLEAGLGGAGKAGKPRRQQKTVTANRPAGGVQVLYKSSKKGRQPGGGGTEFLAKQLQRGGLQAGGNKAQDDEAARNVRALETWQALQELYGEYVTAAVLKDCKGDLEEAIDTLLDQESLPDRLAAIVEHSVQQVEDEVSAAAAAAAAQEAARYERAAGGRPRRGGWAVRPGTYSSGKPQASNPDHFPSLSSHCDRTSRHPRQPRPWQKHKQGFTDRDWGANETLTGPIKVLQNTDSLGNLAAQHGLPVRDVEALKQLFPTLDNHFVASTLADMKGDVNAACDYLVDAGILPGHQSDMDGLLDFLAATSGSDASLNDITAALNGSSTNTSSAPLQPGNGSYLAAAASPTPGTNNDTTTSVAQPQQPDMSVLGDPREPLCFEEKVVRLMGTFEGLDGSLAEFTLRHCGEDLYGAAAFLNECVHADNSAAAAANAKSEALAAAIGRPDSYAGVTEENLPPALGTQASNGLAAALQGQKWPGSQQQQQQQQQQQRQQQQAQQQKQGLTTDGLQGLQGRGEPGSMQQSEAGWQSVGRAAASGGNGYSSRGAGVSARDAADKERSRLQAGKARQIAHIYFSFRNVFFQQANAAYNAGDGKAAAEYSRRGRHYGELAKQFRQASNEAAFKASNLGIRNTFVMDLHGMHVNEAVALLEKQMDALGRLISPEGVLLRCITGWGAHSAKGIALIKPAVMDWAKQNGRKHFVDPDNEGVVIVHVTPQDRYS